MEYVSKLPETKLTNYSQKVLGPNLGSMKKTARTTSSKVILNALYNL